MAGAAGLDENEAGKLAILVTELANNLHKHAREGTILLRRIPTSPGGVEVLSVDRGPGMADVEKCFRDGFSTRGTPGTGLGSVVRLADGWDVYSSLGTGTVVVAEIHSKQKGKSAEGRSRLQFGAVSVPLRGETRSGDTWAQHAKAPFERVMVADGLGHGILAAEAADEAASILEESQAGTLPELMNSMHNALRKTRGAAVALAEFDTTRRVIRYVGVGNISATILHAGTTRSLVSQNGIVGHEARKIQEFQYPWPEGATLVMNSDGLTSRWDVAKYPGLAHRHPSLLAGALWRDFTRGRDDATVLVVREKA
jgi:anti-sigma regulatory factor (Ser/Thr protein kinase)